MVWVEKVSSISSERRSKRKVLKRPPITLISRYCFATASVWKQESQLSQTNASPRVQSIFRIERTREQINDVCSLRKLRWLGYQIHWAIKIGLSGDEKNSISTAGLAVLT